MAKQPRGPDGKWACVPNYPRKRTSTCGCMYGGTTPCAYLREVEELQQELYGVMLEREGVDGQLSAVRSQIASAGRLSHRSRDLGRTGNTSRGKGHSVTNRYGEDSERAYEELLHERTDLRAHHDRLRREAREIRRLISDIRSGRRLSGAARSKVLRYLPGGREHGYQQSHRRPRKYHPHAIPQVALRDYLAAHPGATAYEAQMAWQEGMARTKTQPDVLLGRTGDRMARRGGMR